MKTLWTFLGAIVSALLIVPAMAADLPVKAPMRAPPPQVYNWTGCYIAGGFGYGLYDIDHSVSNPVVGGVPAIFDPGHDNGGRGWLGTVGGGCDLQFAGPLGGNWVIGILGDVDFMNIKGNYSTMCPGGCIGADGYFGPLTESSAGYIGGRIGMTFTPQLLGYVSAGWTETRFDAATLVGFGIPGATAPVTLPAQTFNGWFFGGGTEYAVGFLPGLFWRSEYRFSQYSAKTTPLVCSNLAICNTGGGLNAIDNAKPYVQTVRSELVWRFNPWGTGGVMSRY